MKPQTIVSFLRNDVWQCYVTQSISYTVCLKLSLL